MIWNKIRNHKILYSKKIKKKLGLIFIDLHAYDSETTSKAGADGEAGTLS